MSKVAVPTTTFVVPTPIEATDPRVVAKLQSLALQAHTHRARGAGIRQIVNQFAEKLIPAESELSELRAGLKGFRPSDERYALMAEKVATAESACAAQREKVNAGNQRAAAAERLGHKADTLIAGVLRELGVTAEDLSIDLVDHDHRVPGSHRGNLA